MIYTTDQDAAVIRSHALLHSKILCLNLHEQKYLKRSEVLELLHQTELDIHPTDA